MRHISSDDLLPVLSHETDSCLAHILYTHTHTHWQWFQMKCLNVWNKRSAGEQKEKRNKKQTSNEIITIRREGEVERERKKESWVRVPQWQGTIVPRQWKKRGGGGLSGQ